MLSFWASLENLRVSANFNSSMTIRNHHQGFFLVFLQNSIEWYKDSLQGPVLLKSDTNFYHKVSTFSNDLSFGKEISFDSVSLVDKGRYVCKVAEKGSAYHNQPGKQSINQFFVPSTTISSHLMKGIQPTTIVITE